MGPEAGQDTRVQRTSEAQSGERSRGAMASDQDHLEGTPILKWSPRPCRVAGGGGEGPRRGWLAWLRHIGACRAPPEAVSDGEAHLC